VNELKPAIVRILGNAGRIAGAGFLAGKRTIVTCAHVVAEALSIASTGPDAPSSGVSLDFPLVMPGTVIAANVVMWLPVRNGDQKAAASATPEDIAVLELLCDPPDGCYPVRVVDAADVWDHTFRAFGFPASYDAGVWASGLLRDKQSDGWVQIEDTKGTGYFVSPGFSGTPVWDEMENGVVGIAVVADRRAEVRAAFLIPVRALLSVVPALLAKPEEPPPQVVAPIEAPNAILSFWTDLDPDFRGFHGADRRSPGYRPGVLLIFITSESATDTWDELPAAVLAAARIDLDVLSVRYPLVKTSAKSVAEAAAALRTLISTSFGAYRHHLYVEDDADLVLKRMFLVDAADLMETPSIPFLNETRLTCLCRTIISVTDVHNDGELAESIAGAFRDHVAQYESVGLPTPEIVQSPAVLLRKADAEPARRQTGRTDSNARYASPPKPLTAFIAQRLSQFQSCAAAAIARQTIVRTCAMDPQVRRLFGEEDESLSVDMSDGQAALCHRLTAMANTPTPQNVCVMTGNAGVGKSVLLRFVARRLATILLRGTKRAALPLFFPLSQFKLLAPDPDPEIVWKRLCDESVAWVNEMLLANASEDERERPELITIDQAWVHKQLRITPTMLIFDGIDEFILNHPSLSLTDFAALLRYLRTEFKDNTELFIVAAIRSSARDVTLIAEEESDVLTLRGMAVAEAADMFPSAAKLIATTSDAAVQELLLTPLILSSLEKSGLKLRPENYLNRAALIQAALSAIIASLNRAWTGTPYPISAWINALSLVAWLQYCELRGEIDDHHVAEYAERSMAAWNGEARGDGGSELMTAFKILMDPASRAMLLNHSIFFPVRASSYRVKHKEWGDYLVSRYAILCIRNFRFDDLAARAMNHDIYIMAGQQLQESDTDATTVQALVARSSGGGRFLIIGNFAQMLGDSFAPLTGDVLDREILGKLDLFPPVVKFAMLSALSSRMLLDDPKDPWVAHFRPVLLRTLAERVNDGADNVLIRSMCWCFLRAMNATTRPWPQLWQSEQQSVEALLMIASAQGDHFTANEIQRSIQAAFMRIQSYACEIPSRIISTAHYLYPLALAYSRDVPLDRTVVAELPSLLRDLRLDLAYRTHPIAEIGMIWARCKELNGAHLAEAVVVGRVS